MFISQLRPVGAARLACRMISVAALAGCAQYSTTAAAPALPMPFTATGAEPGWHLQMTPQRLVLQAAYGTVRVEAATPVPRRSAEAVVYEASTPDHRVTVAVQDRYCSNAMSGMPHPYTVTITLDGDTFDGCGGDPATLLNGASWHLQTVAGRPVNAESPPTLSFGADGSVSGYGGCNRYGGSYSLTGEGISISALRSTRMSCSTGEALEQELLRMLEQIARFRLDEAGMLVLETTDGASLTAQRP